MRKAKRYIIKGIVQGVGFRYFTYHIANAIGVFGYVKNLPDGSVEVFAEGTEDRLLTLKNKLKSGPSYSQVEEIIEEEHPASSNYRTFTIR